MVDMAMIGGIANSLNVALNISKAMLSIRDQTLIQEKVLELTSEIITAQQAAIAAVSAQAALIDHVRELEEQIVEMETWKTEKQRYELTRVTPHGSFAYIQKSGMPDSGPSHAICPACYEREKKSILQATAAMEMRYRVYSCPECQTKVPMSGEFTRDASPQTPAT